MPLIGALLEQRRPIANQSSRGHLRQGDLTERTAHSTAAIRRCLLLRRLLESGQSFLSKHFPVSAANAAAVRTAVLAALATAELVDSARDFRIADGGHGINYSLVYNGAAFDGLHKNLSLLLSLQKLLVHQ